MTSKKESILRAAKGEIESRVNYELGKVVDNILDLRTSPTAKRTITVKLDLVPVENRTGIEVKATVKSVLAPTTTVSTELRVTQDENGELCILETTGLCPGQMSIDGAETDAGKIIYISGRSDDDDDDCQ